MLFDSKWILQKGISRWLFSWKTLNTYPNITQICSQNLGFLNTYINPCLVILFCEVQNQNKQKCASRYLYQNNNKRLHFLTQTSPKSFLKISVYLVKNVKSGKTFICWEPYNKLDREKKVCKKSTLYRFFKKLHKFQFRL